MRGDRSREDDGRPGPRGRGERDDMCGEGLGAEEGARQVDVVGSAPVFGRDGEGWHAVYDAGEAEEVRYWA